MKKKIFSQQQQVIVLAVGTLIGTALFFRERIMPLAEQRARLKDESVELKTRLSEMMTFIRAGAPEQPSHSVAITAFAPTNGDGATVVSTAINKAAEQAHVQVLASKVRDPMRRGIFRSFSVEVDVSGDLVSIMRFAHELESQPSFFIESAMLQQKNWRKKAVEAHFVVSRIALAEAIPVEGKVGYLSDSSSASDFSRFAVVYNKRDWFYQLSDNDRPTGEGDQSPVDQKWAKLNDYLLVAVLLTDEPVAVVEQRFDHAPLFLKIKDRVDTMIVADIQKNKIVFEQGQEKRELIFP